MNPFEEHYLGINKKNGRAYWRKSMADLIVTIKGCGYSYDLPDDWTIFIVQKSGGSIAGVAYLPVNPSVYSVVPTRGSVWL